MYESSIEETFKKGLLRWANGHSIELDIVKMNIQGRRGWPDRMILWEGGNKVFIEFKRPGEDARPLQEYVHEKLKRMGFKVRVYDNADAALEWVKAQIRATTITDKGDAFGGEGGGVPPVP
jgi:hypothetical protein